MNASAKVQFRLNKTSGLKIQAIIISVDSGNLRFRNLSFIDMIQMEEVGATGSFTKHDFFTVENQKEIFYMGGNELNKDIQFEVEEIGVVATVFSITVVPDNDFSNLFERLRLFFIGKTKATQFNPPEGGVF